MTRRVGLAGLGLVSVLALIAGSRHADAQLRFASPPANPDGGRLAGLRWTFVRIHYLPNASPTRYLMTYGMEPWQTDGPAAEQNLSRRVKTTTSIEVGDPIAMTLDDSRLWQYPWIYFVEPSSMRLQPNEIPILREFFARGGTAYMDDFHGPAEWADFEQQMKLLFPDRKIVDLPPEHPIFHCFYEFSSFPQTPGLGSFLQGRTWEKGGFNARLRTILDDDGRPMLFINWNTDMGDGWEWSNAEEYPDYIQYTSLAYRMGINEIVYALTH